MIPRRSSQLVVGLVAAFAVTSTSVAQDEWWQQYGTHGANSLGSSLAFGDDLNGDGVRELLCMATGIPHGAPGRLKIMSGVSGRKLRHHDCEIDSIVASLGDVDADGVDDYAIGSPGVGAVLIYSGSDARLLERLLDVARFGEAITGLGDLDDDGHDDYAISRGADLDSVDVYSGRDGSLLYRAGPEVYGGSLGSVADRDGDGERELLVGSPVQDRVEVRSGADGSLLLRIPGPVDTDFGQTVASLGDLDGDGVEDLAVGAPRDAVNGPAAGRVYAFSGADGAVRFEVGGDSGDALGASLATAGDANGDGFEDLVAGAPASDRHHLNGGLVRLLSGLDGALLWEFAPTEPRQALGRAVAGGADLDLDGRPEIAAGSPSFFTMGQVQTFLGSRVYFEHPAVVRAGDELELSVAQGQVGRTVSIFSLAFGQTPFVFLISRGPVDNEGRYRYAATVPPGLEGNDLDMLAFAVDQRGKVAASRVRTLRFE